MSQLNVIFGAGPLAQATMRALLRRGQAVKMVNRSGKRPADAPTQVEIIAGDAYNIEFTRQVTQGPQSFTNAPNLNSRMGDKISPSTSSHPGRCGIQWFEVNCG